MNEVRALSRAKKAAFWSGDKEAYSPTRAKLKADIKEAKQRHQERLERHQQHQRNVISNVDSDHHRLQKQKCPAPIMCETMLPDELNTFYVRFDLLNKESALKSTPPPDDRPLSVSTADVRRTLISLIKCCEKLVLRHWFTFRTNRSTKDAISTAQIN